jgi:signal transduction histidine kinase
MDAAGIQYDASVPRTRVLRRSYGEILTTINDSNDSMTPLLTLSLGIQQKFIALALALLVCVSLFIAWFFPMRQEQEMSEYLNQKALVLAEVTAYSTAAGVMFDDTSSVRTALDGVKGLPDVLFVITYNTQGMQMGAVKQGNAKPHQSIIDTVRASLVPIVYEARDLTVAAVPITLNNATHGQLVLGLTRRFLRDDVQRSRRLTLAVSAAILLLGGLIFYWQTSRLVRPIKTLEAAAEQVSEGVLSIEAVPVASHDEIGTLTGVFNQMVANLRDYVQRVERQSHELGVVNAKLQENNLELAAANEEIQRQIEVQTEQAREIELANAELQEKNLALDEAFTELTHTQSQLVQSERMNATGMLTAGVMHEINNPNAAVIAAVHDVKHTVSQMSDFFGSLLDERGRQSKKAQQFDQMSHDAQHTLDVAMNGAQRVKNIVANLQHFTKHQRTGTYQSTLAAELESTAEIFRYQFKTVSVTLAVEESASVKGNFGELNQVFLNLLVNAAQAGATSIVITGKRATDAGDVVLSIADNGKGMTDDVQRRIFEPFFSTKGAGNSGLGLSISKQILERHGVSIAVESAPQQGTTFFLTFHNAYNAHNAFASV